MGWGAAHLLSSCGHVAAQGCLPISPDRHGQAKPGVGTTPAPSTSWCPGQTQLSKMNFSAAPTCLVCTQWDSRVTVCSTALTEQSASHRSPSQVWPSATPLHLPANLLLCLCFYLVQNVILMESPSTWPVGSPPFTQQNGLSVNCVAVRRGHSLFGPAAPHPPGAQGLEARDGHLSGSAGSNGNEAAINTHMALLAPSFPGALMTRAYQVSVFHFLGTVPFSSGCHVCAFVSIWQRRWEAIQRPGWKQGCQEPGTGEGTPERQVLRPLLLQEQTAPLPSLSSSVFMQQSCFRSPFAGTAC